jgi:ribosomal protein L11 methylase PrmA
MGAKYVLAVDHDVAAVENCRENFTANRVSATHEIVFGSIETCSRRDPFDFVCVNIIKSFILPHLDRLLGLVVKGGILVLSGLLSDDEEEISAGLREFDQDDFTIISDNQWLTYVVQKR